MGASFPDRYSAELGTSSDFYWTGHWTWFSSLCRIVAWDATCHSSETQRLTLLIVEIMRHSFAWCGGLSIFVGYLLWENFQDFNLVDLLKEVLLKIENKLQRWVNIFVEMQILPKMTALSNKWKNEYNLFTIHIKALFKIALLYKNWKQYFNLSCRVTFYWTENVYNYGWS